MMKKLCFLITITLFLGLTGSGQAKPKNVMLVLGSANPETLSNRVGVASKLYQIQKIDKIIVSGGCGAHASTICEAEAMKNQLIAKGVPEGIIYKEQNSKTTVQNYIFSRVLKDENGEQIIQKNDSLYVVSDHWHAIAVAARFNKYDDVHAKFFIEGDLVPSPKDLLDYGGIFNKEADNDIFILKGLWPTPDAVFSANGCTEYFFADRVYSVNSNQPADATLNSIASFKPTIPTNWGNVDAIANDVQKKQLLLFNGLQCQISSTRKNSASSIVPLSQLIKNLPANIKRVDASFMKQNELYLFSGSEVMIAKRDGNKFNISKTEDVKKWVGNWPYAWASGDLTAADYDTKNKVIYLYKNREVLKIDLQNNSETLPQKLMLKWQDIN